MTSLTGCWEFCRTFFGHYFPVKLTLWHRYLNNNNTVTTRIQVHLFGIFLVTVSIITKFQNLSKPSEFLKPASETSKMSMKFNVTIVIRCLPHFDSLFLIVRCHFIKFMFANKLYNNLLCSTVPKVWPDLKRFRYRLDTISNI